ncbi:hypothetical protein Dimus_014972 [Dionaea muscipula]
MVIPSSFLANPAEEVSESGALVSCSDVSGKTPPPCPNDLSDQIPSFPAEQLNSYGDDVVPGTNNPSIGHSILPMCSGNDRSNVHCSFFAPPTWAPGVGAHSADAINLSSADLPSIDLVHDTGHVNESHAADTPVDRPPNEVIPDSDAEKEPPRSLAEIADTSLVSSILSPPPDESCNPRLAVGDAAPANDTTTSSLVESAAGAERKMQDLEFAALDDITP